MKKIVLLFFIFFAITARVDFAKASTIANPAYTFIVSKSYNSSDRPRIDDTPFGHPTMYNELVVNRATEAVNLIGTEFPSVDKDALRDFFILNIGTSYGFKQ